MQPHNKLEDIGLEDLLAEIKRRENLQAIEETVAPVPDFIVTHKYEISDDGPIITHAFADDGAEGFEYLIKSDYPLSDAQVDAIVRAEIKTWEDDLQPEVIEHVYASRIGQYSLTLILTDGDEDA